MDTALIAPYRFGRFELNPTTRQVVADGKPLMLGAKAFDVLCALIERRERLVTKDELLELVWPNLVVEENNLQVQVSSLRKTLGTEAIATIPGRGYRFALELSPAGEPPPAPEARRHNLPHPLTSSDARHGRGSELRLQPDLHGDRRSGVRRLMRHRRSYR